MQADCLDHLRLQHERSYIDKLREQREKLERLRTEFDGKVELLSQRDEEIARLGRQVKRLEE
jgi:hypothetical protein